MRNIFVAIEGADRSGKTTLISELEKVLKSRGVEVKRMRYPNRNNLTGKLIDSILKGEKKIHSKSLHLLFSANRWEDAEEIKSFIREREEENKKNSNTPLHSSTERYPPSILLCDRYSLSGLSYAMLEGVDKEVSICDLNLPKPDITIFLDVDANKRMKREGFGKEIFEKLSLQKRVGDFMKKNLKYQKNPGIIEDASLEDSLTQALTIIDEYIQRRKMG